MSKNRTLVRLMRFLITLLGAGLGAGAAALLIPLLVRLNPSMQGSFSALAGIYGGLILLGSLICFAFSMPLVERTLRVLSFAERRMEKMSLQQALLTSAGLVTGLLIAFLITQLVLSAGTSLITLSFSALMYVALGSLGARIGLRHGRDGKRRFMRRRGEAADLAAQALDDDASADEEEPSAQPRKYLDTSVIIDGRILDIVRTGFLEGELVVPQFVLAELRHIADSGDGLRRARGRRGLDVLQKLQKEAGVTVDETDYPDLAEVDVKLLRLCRDGGGVVVTNDYNLNKVAGVTGIRVLNVNDLANAVKPMLMTGEELRVQVVREGKEPGQGVAYLDDGTMIVIENGRRHVGQTISVTVTTVLQTSAGRMIFTKANGEQVAPRTAV